MNIFIYLFRSMYGLVYSFIYVNCLSFSQALYIYLCIYTCMIQRYVYLLIRLQIHLYIYIVYGWSRKGGSLRITLSIPKRRFARKGGPVPPKLIFLFFQPKLRFLEMAHTNFVSSIQKTAYQLLAWSKNHKNAISIVKKQFPARFSKIQLSKLKIASFWTSTTQKHCP